MNERSSSLPVASLNALVEAATALNSSLDLRAVLQTVGRLACEVARAEASSLFAYDSTRQKLTGLAATGPRRDAIIGRDFDARLGICGQVVRHGRPIRVFDVRNDPAYCEAIDNIGLRQTRTVMAAPLVRRGEVLGVLEVANRRDELAFDEADLRMLQIFATFAAGAMHNARAHAELQQRYDGLRETVSAPPGIIGDSWRFREALQLCERVAPTNASVLILGETGTGKEVIARHIHSVSRRRSADFVAVNCAALPETLLESELFGHEKGSFTSAHARRIGRFELADKGTLFLDEIGEISRSTQAKLLRVLQEKEFVRVGGTETIRCDVRIIAATNRNLKNMMADGLFRDDLYYRLSVFPVQLPPLRERPEDIPKLVKHFAERAAREYRIAQLRIAPQAMQALATYEWRGNIRELQNVIERSVLMCEGGVLQPNHLPPDIQAAAAGDGATEPTSSLESQERAMIARALEDHQWNQSQAARALGITRYHLRHRVRKYQLRPNGETGPAH